MIRTPCSSRAPLVAAVPVARALGSPLALVLALALALQLTGCSGNSTKPSPQAPSQVGWIAPAPNDTLRGMAEFAAWVDLGEPVREVTFFVNGTDVGTLATVPWSMEWKPADVESGPELRSLRLEVEARGDATTVRGGPIEVWYQRDDPPTITLTHPGGTDWVEIGRDRFLVAEVADREDGAIDPSAVEWRTELGRRFRGSHLPIELLGSGDHELEAWITDSAGNMSEAHASVHTFSYDGTESALGTARDLQRALSALDLETVETLLNEQFEVRTCDDPPSTRAPDPLSRSEFLSSLQSVATDPSLRSFRWGGQIDLRAEETRGWAIARWRQLGILIVRGNDEWRTVRLSGELVLRRSLDGSWRVATWRELDPGDGPGVAGLLRSGLPDP